MSENLESLGKCQCGAEGTTWDDDHVLLCQPCLKDCQIDALEAELKKVKGNLRGAIQATAYTRKDVDSLTAQLAEKDTRIEELEKRDVEQYIGYIQYAVLCQIRAKTDTASDDPILDIISLTISRCIFARLDKIAALKGGE